MALTAAAAAQPLVGSLCIVTGDTDSTVVWLIPIPNESARRASAMARDEASASAAMRASVTSLDMGVLRWVGSEPSATPDSTDAGHLWIYHVLTDDRSGAASAA